VTRSRALNVATALAITLNLTCMVAAAWWHRPGLVAVTAAAAVWCAVVGWAGRGRQA
jgi:hypothetical protein